MASNGEIAQAYASLSQAFLSDTKPRINSAIQRADAGASWDEIGSDITSVRNDLESIYSQINDLINQAKANSPQDTALIGRMETSLNTNRGRNLSLIAQAEQKARSNQEPPPEPEDTESIGEEAPENEPKTAKDAEEQNGEKEQQFDENGDPIPDISNDGGGETTDKPASETPVKAVTTAPQPDPPYYGYSKFSGIYKVISIKNSFSSGKFEQTLSLARVYQTNEIIEKAREQEKIIDKQTNKEEITPLKHVPVVPAKVQASFASVLNAKVDGGADILKTVSDAASGVTGGIKDIAGGVGDALGAIGGGVGEALETVSGAIKDPTGAVSRLSTLNVGSALYSGTSDADLTYSGDDEIVRNRINAERASRGLTSLDEAAGGVE